SRARSRRSRRRRSRRRATSRGGAGGHGGRAGPSSEHRARHVDTARRLALRRATWRAFHRPRSRPRNRSRSGLTNFTPSLSREAVAAHEAVEVGAVDAGGARGGRDVVAVDPQELLDVAALELGEDLVASLLVRLDVVVGGGLGGGEVVEHGAALEVVA